ncbi:hypothetical protein PAI11_24470 [Patulibacter medicamentivorans]|uniref:Uncharacterized protein n=1 Tax=Patulibacter medicamentivorans TaxID=1097667 RepID=H0E6J7_9ACTN|nr:hypothetical protein [Patulibacter medicamentivorans]EHN10696.1 hypothetical protein PAI11_24470 [Patulibacter medicamentivorans]
MSPSRSVRHLRPALLATAALAVPIGPALLSPLASAADPVVPAEQQLQGAAPADLWSVADAVVAPIDGQWSSSAGAYVVNGVPRARLNAEMLLVHAYAAIGDRPSAGGGRHDDRIEPLVRLLTGPMYVATLEGKVTQAPEAGHSVTTHAPGFADASGNVNTMHQSLDAVVMRALAAAWRARTAAHLSPEVQALIRDRVSAVARSPFWRSPSRLLNQINWNADVYAADATVTGDPTLLREDYRAQLQWFLARARKTAYPKGDTNLASGLGFHYLPNRPPSTSTNRSDTAEYANIAYGALAYYDQALQAGMAPLSAGERRLLRDWTRRIAYGNWTNAGYLNWDSGKGVQRLHLTQYWLLALRGFVAGASGSASAGWLPEQAETARWLLHQAVAHYQQRAAESRSVILPAASFGMTGSNLVSDSFDGLTGTARFASTLAELADRGLAGGTGSALPAAVSHDADLGRLAVTTPRLSTAILAPWSPMRVGGLEPARLLDGAARPLTGIGGSGPGSLGLTLRSGASTLIETEPGKPRKSESALKVPAANRNASRTLSGTLTVSGTDSASRLGLTVSHRISTAAIRTTYTIRNSRPGTVTAELRIPTYGKGSGSLTVGQKLSATALARQRAIVAPSGGRFTLGLKGLPRGATGQVVKVAAQKGNPTPGPQLRIRFTVPSGTTRVQRLIKVPAAG